MHIEVEYRKVNQNHWRKLNTQKWEIINFYNK
jgi:hypothetical protein